MLETIYNYGTLAVAVISTTIAVIKFIQAKKNSNSVEVKNEENSKLKKVLELAKIVQQIPELVCKAEILFPSTNEVKFGTQKLTYVLMEIEKLCIKSDVEFNEKDFIYEIEKILETPTKSEVREVEI